MYNELMLTDFIEVEWKFAGDRTVETRLEEGRPAVTETMRSTSIVLAHSCHSGEHGLQQRDMLLINPLIA